jgi:hypothetical protein
MKKTNYQPPVAVEIVTDYQGILCTSDPNGLGGYGDDVTPDYGEDD